MIATQSEPVSLKEYLGIALELERSNYLEEALAGNLSPEIRRLGHENTIAMPEAPVLRSHIGLFISGLLVAGLILLLVYSIHLVATLGPQETRGGTLVVGLILFILVVISFFLYGYHNFKKYNDGVLNQYNQELAEAEALLAADKARVAEERQRRAFLEGELAGVERQRAATQAALQRVYGKNILFPKYRNLVALCSIYEYVSAGRCTTLEGHEGAYNIYESEIRQDKIITQLSSVISSLGKIQSNQFTLYTAINENSQRLSGLIEATTQMSSQLSSKLGSANDRLSAMEKQSALSAYHAEQSAKELRYMNRMDYLSGRNDSVFYNIPPN